MATSSEHAALPAAWQPWQATRTDPWDRRKAAHLLRRAGFAATPGELQQAVALGADAVIDLLLNPPWEEVQEFGTCVLPNGEMLHVSRLLPDQRAAWLFRLVHGGAPLREKLALFWHDHFSVGNKYGSNRSHMLPHVNRLRRHAFGTVRDLLCSLLTDPAMLVWLDNWSNGRPERGVPQLNLNFSRELFELYTMGVGGGYTQADVEAAAACLSGHGLVMGLTTNATVYRDSWHVAGDKRVLGQPVRAKGGAAEAEAMIGILLDWPGTANFLASKLVRWFVTDPAPDELLRPLASWWRTRDLSVRALLSVLLRSRLFFSERVIRRAVKDPVEFAVGALRQTGPARVGSYRALGTWIARMGWRLLEYFTPAGHAQGMAWLSMQTLIMRANFAHELVAGGGEVRAVLDPELLQSRGEWFERFVDDEASPGLVQACRELRPHEALRVLLASPEYQVK